MKEYKYFFVKKGTPALVLIANEEDLGPEVPNRIVSAKVSLQHVASDSVEPADGPAVLLVDLVDTARHTGLAKLLTLIYPRVVPELHVIVRGSQSANAELVDQSDVLIRSYPQFGVKTSPQQLVPG